MPAKARRSAAARATSAKGKAARPKAASAKHPRAKVAGKPVRASAKGPVPQASPEKQLRAELVASFKNRALLYWHFFDTMRKAMGEAETTRLMRDAIYARGLEVGKRFAKYGPADMTGIRDAFLRFIPDNGALFQPEVVRCDGGGVDIQFHRCPLKEAWMEAGIPADDMAKLCHIAGRVDNGTFEGAGFRFSADTWQPGRSGCCFLHIRPGK